MIDIAEEPGDLSRLVVPLRGALESTGDLFAPYRLVDGDGRPVAPAVAFFAELTACGRPATTQRSYGMDLLRWFRFLWAVEVGWDQATRVEARDFVRWLQVAVKPARPHWRDPSGRPAPRDRAAVGRVNAVTGKPSRGERYEASTVVHCESVLRGFYDFHLARWVSPRTPKGAQTASECLCRAGTGIRRLSGGWYLSPSGDCGSGSVALAISHGPSERTIPYVWTRPPVFWHAVVPRHLSVRS